MGPAPNRRCLWQGDFLNRLPHFNQLCCAGLGMGLQFAPFGPLIGVVVVIHVAQHQALLGSMHDHSDVAADADRPEIRVPGSIQLVESQSRLGRVQLKVKGRGLHRLLLVTGQLGETAGEGVGDAEFHHSSSLVVRPAR